jgi:hypothetical protein
LILRNLDVPDGGSLPATIDFDGPASSAPATASVTVTGAAGEYLEAYSEVVTGNGTTLLWFDLDPSPTETRPWGGLPSSAMASGDLHTLLVFASPEIGSPEYRVALEYLGPVGNRTISLGPLIDVGPAAQVAGGPYPRFRFQGSLPAAYDEGAAVDIVHAESSGNAYSIYATRAYLGASGPGLTYDLTMPELSPFSGFPAAARLTAGENEAFVGGFGFTGSGVFDPQPAPGIEFRAVAKRVLVQVP